MEQRAIMAITQSVDLPPKHVNVMGVRISCFDSYEHACELIATAVANRVQATCVAITPRKIHMAQTSSELRGILNAASFQICDGVGAAIGAWVLAGVLPTRVTGVSLFFRLIDLAAKRGYRVYLLGASKESNQSACERLRATFPTLQIVGARNGYFDDSLAVVDEINASGAEMLFVGMGSPGQEEWLAQHREQLDVPYAMCVGGTIDVAGGVAKWAPLVFRKTGTEWFYRLLCDPRRWRRQLRLPMFLLALLRAKVHGKT